MSPYFYSLIIILGLVVGSFLSALTYRLPRNKSVTFGRSFCDHCKRKIRWYDNIPLISYLALRGECRNCSKKISLRYPLIELFTAVLFLVFTYTLFNCKDTLNSEILCDLRSLLGNWVIPYLLFILSMVITIFIIDLEHKIIPDNIVFYLFIVTFLVFLASSSPTLIPRLVSAFGSSMFLLLIHLLTKGRGMGLGDVKLALFVGLLLGWPKTLTWLYLSFVIGALIGLMLIMFKKAKFGKQIPFGPFMILSLIITLIWGNFFNGLIFLYLP